MVNSEKNKKGIVLLSGGLDSTTLLAVAQSEDYQIYALTFDYGQRHVIELESAKAIAKACAVYEHRVIKIDLRAFGTSALTADIDVPSHRCESEIANGIPITYVPARNTIFLSYALAWAETLEAQSIFIGVNAVDYSGYPDCRGEYLEAFQKLANLATKKGVEGFQLKIQAPLIQLTKSEIIRLGVSLGVDYSMTTSCYNPDPNGMACGVCDSCVLRRKGFKEAGMKDPIAYSVERIADRKTKSKKHH
ncbi:7-cyano-7-deazaguanine synthase QueC [PVC group bacterium]|nr:7-cyano-7-deazaguanine synthase QueC [PVC group bacterium]